MKILKDFDPTKQQLHDYFAHERRGEIFLPKELVNELDRYCQGCGKPYGNQKQVEYFKQTFCAPCVEKWKAGK